MPLGTKVGLGPGRIVLHGNPVPLPKGAQPPNFRSMSAVANGRPSQLLLSTCHNCHSETNPGEHMYSGASFRANEVYAQN